MRAFFIVIKCHVFNISYYIFTIMIGNMIDDKRNVSNQIPNRIFIFSRKEKYDGNRLYRRNRFHLTMVWISQFLPLDNVLSLLSFITVF